MVISILEMPAEGTYVITLDGERIKGYIRHHQVKDVWVVKTGDSDLRTQPVSREAAAMLLLFHHFTNERRKIKEATVSG